MDNFQGICEHKKSPNRTILFGDSLRRKQEARPTCEALKPLPIAGLCLRLCPLSPLSLRQAERLLLTTPYVAAGKASCFLSLIESQKYLDCKEKSADIRKKSPPTL